LRELDGRHRQGETDAISCSYYLEPVETGDLPRRFLKRSRRSSPTQLRADARRGGALPPVARCAPACQIFQASGETRDIPCHRSELLLRVFRRYFMPAGALKGRLGTGFELDEAYINTMAEELYRCTACRRCNLECPIGLDHGQITHLGRWVLAEGRHRAEALRVATREQLTGKTATGLGDPASRCRTPARSSRTTAVTPTASR
jgi:hypothetical protein